jgi:outer membrane protein
MSMKSLFRGLCRLSLIVAIGAACVAPTASKVFAQATIGFADADLVLVNLPECQETRRKVEDQVIGCQEALQSLGADLQADVEKLDKQAPILSPEKLAERQQELQQRYIELQEAGARKEQELGQLEQELMNPLFERVNEAVQTVAASKNLQVVLKSSALLYVDQASVTDITADVARSLGIEVDDQPTAEPGAGVSSAEPGS